MKTSPLRLASLALALLATACGSKSSDSPAPASSTATAWSDTAMQAIVVNNCAISGCHAGAQAPNYSGISEAAMKADTTARDQVAAGIMPQSGVLSSAQRATVAAFYAR